MALSDDDVREILRLIDDSELSELRVETEGLSLHVVRGGPAPPPEPEPHDGAQGPAAAVDGGGVGDAATIESPMLGVFYRAPSPGAPPFVEVGTRVEPDSIVCLIEVMKMMNSIPAGLSGTVVEVVAVNAEPVEYGEALFRVRPG